MKPKNTWLAAALLACITMAPAVAQRTLTKLWETDATLSVPESVLYDAKRQLLWVSNIGGGKPEELKGSIAKVSLDGQVIEAEWIKGLKAPKGLGKAGNLLYAADPEEVVVMDLTKGSVVRRIPIEGAKMLNDITVDSKGVVYVSDTRAGKIHQIRNFKPSVVVENVKDVNGLLAVGKNLYVMADGAMHLMTPNKKLQKITDGIEGFADGVEQVKPGEFVVTGWEGTIYYVTADGQKQTLSDTRSQKISAADLGYHPGKRIVYIPTFRTNTVVAYELK